MARRGGARKGAGRKKGWRKSKDFLPPAAAAPESHQPQTAPAAVAAIEPSPPPAQPKRYESAEDYLEAVVTGEAPPDRDRIAAAKAMLPYQIAKRRLPVKADAPRQMELSRELEQEKQHLEEWDQTRKAVSLRIVGRGAPNGAR